jgi:hypothetical protein
MNAFARHLCRFLIVALTVLSVSTANAGIVTVDQVGASWAAANRAAVLDFISRAEVASALAERGVDPHQARERVAAMTDAEIDNVKGQIDALPAGAFAPIGGAVYFAVLAIALLVGLVARAIYEGVTTE